MDRKLFYGIWRRRLGMQGGEALEAEIRPELTVDDPPSPSKSGRQMELRCLN